MKNLKHISKCLLFLTLVLLVSCNRFLDIKPDTSQSVPETLFDFRRLLNNESSMNFIFGAAGEIGSDNIFLEEKNWLALGKGTEQNLYIWADNVFNDYNINSWTLPYITVFYSNVILEGLEKITPNSMEIKEWKEIKGSALFFRAFAFYDLSTHFGQPFNSNTADQDLGIVLRLSSDSNKKSKRATVFECYNQMIEDLKKSLDLLPDLEEFKMRPSKAAAYGLLARIYLDMEDYIEAEKYASEFLELNSRLLDFNTLDLSMANSIPRQNIEIVFYSSLYSFWILDKANARIAPEIFASFDENDLRKLVFAKEAGNGYHSFSGNYDGSERFFNGFAVDELLLVRAECRARLNRPVEALADLNYLLRNRYKAGTYTNFESSNSNEVLLKVLEERKKELMFRGIRWADLRRLNKTPETSVILKRKLGENTHELEPKSLKYSWLIPQNVIESTGIEQNKR